MEKITTSLEEFEAEAATFARRVSPCATGGATLVTLSGELGAGKTAFVKVVARELGITESVTSPTFVLMKSYSLPEASPTLGDASPAFHHLVHLDAYRLESGKDLNPLNFDEYMKQADNLIMLEWPEKVADALPLPAIRIAFEILEDGTRRISYA
jgi:tRNA threonylcarbamoyladenosine biosynthesis protein TsaE